MSVATQNESRVLLLIAGRGYCLSKRGFYNGQTVYCINSRTFAEEDGPVFFSSQEQKFVHKSSSITAVLCPSAKPGHCIRSSRQRRLCQKPRNVILKFIMSKTVHIGSSSQFTSLLQSSKIVVTDCMSQGLRHAPLACFPLPRRLVSTSKWLI